MGGTPGDHARRGHGLQPAGHIRRQHATTIWRRQQRGLPPAAGGDHGVVAGSIAACVGLRARRLWGVALGRVERPRCVASRLFAVRQHAPVVLSLEGDNLVYCALNCTVTERVLSDGDVRAARVLAVPFLRPQTRADGLQPHADEYYRLLAREPPWVERSVLLNSPRKKLFVARVFKHGESAYQRLRVNISLKPLSAGWYVAGMFPPEKFQHDFIVIRPQASESAAAVIVYLASSSRIKELSDFVLVVELQQSTKYDENSIKHATPGPTAESVTTLCPPVQRPLTLSALRERVFGVIAKVMQVDVDILSEDIYLHELGVDSLSSLEIASELNRTVRIDSLTGYILFGAVSIGDVVKHLRFAARPSFALMGTRFTGHHVVARQGPGLTTPRFSADKARYCFLEIPSHFSLAVFCISASGKSRVSTSITAMCIGKEENRCLRL